MNERLFLAVAGRIVPGVGSLDAAGRQAFLALVREFMESKPPALRRQIDLFLSLIRWLPLARHLRPFEALSPERQDAVLLGFQESRLLLLRRGFWGLKALAFMGYYGRPVAAAAVGWRPEREGNRRLHP
ncbi:MAG: hypothetical protein HY719_00685 [Planctomycetes bacterium]|nr:hypothetical protein [Planctomycetota bacterium]